MSTEWQYDGNLLEVANHMRECGLAWEPKCRLIGNCRAEDITLIAADYLASKRKLAELEKLVADLESGERVILPKTLQHSRALYAVAFNAMQQLTPRDTSHQP